MRGEVELFKLVRPCSRGRITIPAEFRNRLGMDEETTLRVTLQDDELRILPIREAQSTQGSPWLRELYEYFALVREEILARGISDEEINVASDAAMAAVRAEQRSTPTRPLRPIL